MLPRWFCLLAALTLPACKAQSGAATSPVAPPTAPASAPPATTGASMSASPPGVPMPSDRDPKMTHPIPSASGDPAALASVASGDRDFAARLYGQVRGAPGNLFFSPTSIRLALGMAYVGARGDTKGEMGHVLGLDDKSASGFATLLAQWSARASVAVPDNANDWQRAGAERARLVLRVANRLWGQSGRAFQPDFLSRLRDAFGAPLESLDFHAAPDPSRLTINTWVADHTEQRIRDLLPAGSVDSETRLVVTNAVYFKAHWANEFYEGATKSGPFTTAPGNVVAAPLMETTAYFRHATLTAGGVPLAAVELPYGAPGLAMTILLPDAKDGLRALESKLDGALLDTVVARLASRRVDVTLPRFRATSSFSLGEALSALGMPTAFQSGKADFSGMDGTHEIFLGAVVHKAFVAVDEKGTEAAAATAVAMAGMGVPTDEPAVFRADHPFVYVITDTTNHTVLFMGRIVNPAA